jgi:hypothetical protein
VELAGSNSHSPPSYYQQLARARISVGDVQVQQTEALLSSRRVTFSTVHHVRTHGIEYDHAQFDKEYPLSLGWDILGCEDYFVLGHYHDNDDEDDVKAAETEGPKKLSVQKRRKRLK